VLQKVEIQKWTREHDTYEERIVHLERDLAIAQAAQAQLDEQKQENLMLKETIDRMRFDMDEMRNNAVAGHDKGGNSGQSSAVNSVSKSLGAELMGKMNASWEMLEHERDESAKGDIVEVEEEEENTEGEENVVQTIITRKTRVRELCLKLQRVLTTSYRRRYLVARIKLRPADTRKSKSTQMPTPNTSSPNSHLQQQPKPIPSAPPLCLRKP
jgi:hypothetical protein